jgi:hypothetical protein
MLSVRCWCWEKNSQPRCRCTSLSVSLPAQYYQHSPTFLLYPVMPYWIFRLWPGPHNALCCPHQYFFYISSSHHLFFPFFPFCLCIFSLSFQVFLIQLLTSTSISLSLLGFFSHFLFHLSFPIVSSPREL